MASCNGWQELPLPLVERDPHTFMMQVTVGAIGTKSAFPFDEANARAVAKDWMAQAAQGCRSPVIRLSTNGLH